MVRMMTLLLLLPGTCDSARDRAKQTMLGNHPPKGGLTRGPMVGLMPASTGGYTKIGKDPSRSCLLNCSGGARPRTKDGLDQILWRIGRERRVFRDGVRGLLQLEGLLVAVQVGDAPRALGQVLVELDALVGRQGAGEILVQELGEFATVHMSPLRKCGSRSVRSACRARCSRVFTTPWLVPSARAVSRVSSPSMSRKSKTVR